MPDQIGEDFAAKLIERLLERLEAFPQLASQLGADVHQLALAATKRQGEIDALKDRVSKLEAHRAWMLGVAASSWVALLMYALAHRS